MKRLTEEMVVARTKISDMSKIKRLNCWGSELVDVSLLRKMPCVEVLSLSINKINSLCEFEHCRQLQELYVRQNDIRDLNQVCYLQNLTNLRHLWLGENPCAYADGYRMAVIRALPQLQKLDNQTIQPEELSDALKRGRVLAHPDEQEEESPQQHYTQYTTADRSSPWQEQECEQDEPIEYYEDERRTYDSPPRQSPPRRQTVEARRSFSPEHETPPVYYEDRRNANSYDQESPKHQQYYDRSPVKEYMEETRITPESPREIKLPTSHSNNSVKDYVNGDRGYNNYRPLEGSDSSNHSNSGGYEVSRARDHRDRERCDKNSCPANHRPPFNRRPVTRNSNILSAVLCLVKELDYPSLEVVEMAVRCRMDELED